MRDIIALLLLVFVAILTCFISLELGYYKGKSEQLEKYVQLANPKNDEVVEIENPEVKIK